MMGTVSSQSVDQLYSQPSSMLTDPMYLHHRVSARGTKEASLDSRKNMMSKQTQTGQL